MNQPVKGCRIIQTNHLKAQKKADNAAQSITSTYHEQLAVETKRQFGGNNTWETEVLSHHPKNQSCCAILIRVTLFPVNNPIMECVTSTLVFAEVEYGSACC